MLSSPPSSKILSAPCPTKDCCGFLMYLNSDTLAECWTCKQKHKVSLLENNGEMKDIGSALVSLLRMMANNTSKPEAPVSKVLGLTTYQCKLLSPLLTKYGIDRTGKAKPLNELKNCSTFDCGWLGDRSFCIETEYIDVPGYGRDQSGSVHYLSGTLSLLRSYNNNRDALVPLHVDGDGHCLVHAVSRAIVGRELFWHALRTSLKLHLEENLPRYKALLSDFINSSEWEDIIAECDPEYAPCDNEILGLRNIHVFGLANVLRRPILLVDSVAGMQSCGDYSALFLPGLVPPEQCQNRSGEMNKPICLAWSSSGRNHYIPLVGIRGCDPAVFPRSLLPKVWGVPQTLIKDYIEFNDEDCLTIGGGRVMHDSYLLKLTSAMDRLFLQRSGVHPGLVADVYYCNFRKAAGFGIQPNEVVNATKTAIQDHRLFQCTACGGMNLQPLSMDWLRPRGLLYNLAKQQAQGGTLLDQQKYTFHNYGVICTYNAQKDVLILDKSAPPLEICCWCDSTQLRQVNLDGSVVYENGDKTSTVVTSIKVRCQCGFKHWYNGREYDNPPIRIPLCLEWGSRLLMDEVLWFQDESDPSLNSKPYQVAAFVTHKHFPGEMGTGRLQQRIMDILVEKTAATAHSVPSATVSSAGVQDIQNVRDRIGGTPVSSVLQSTDQMAPQPEQQITKKFPKSIGSLHSSPGLNSKKRQSDEHCGAVPKQRSSAVALAAAAAISRASAAAKGNAVTSDTIVRTIPKTKSIEEPQRVIRLGPGYSVMRESFEHSTDNMSEECQEHSQEDLLERCLKAAQMLNKCFEQMNHVREDEPILKHSATNPANVVAGSSGNLSGLPEGPDQSSRSGRLSQDGAWGLMGSYGSLSLVAHLMNPNAGRGRSRSDSLTDDEMAWSEEEDRL